MSNSLRPHGLQHTRPPCPSPTPGVYSNSCPLSQSMPFKYYQILVRIHVFGNKCIVTKDMNKNAHRGFIHSVQFSHSVISNCLRTHGLQHTRPLCPSPSPRVYSNSCPLSQWCHPTISSCHPFLLLPSIFPSIRAFSNESVVRIRQPKYWSFSFSRYWMWY